MTCESDCQSCSSGNKDYEIVTLDYSKEVKPGDVYTVNVRVRINAILGTVIACLYDIDSNLCIASTQRIDFWTGGYRDISLSGIMGNSDLHLNLSIVEPYAFNLFQSTCEDNRYFTIRVYVPPESRWSCDTSSKSCYEDSNSTMTKSQCDAKCGGAGTTDKVVCTANDMNIMGICVPKPVVLGVFALGAIYIFKS